MTDYTKIDGGVPGGTWVNETSTADSVETARNQSMVLAQAVSDYLTGSGESLQPTLSVPHGGLSLDSLVRALGDEERKLAVKTGLETLEDRKKEQAELNEKKLQEIQERLDNMAKSKSTNFFLKIFKIIGAALGAIAGVAAVVAGAITANPVMIVGGILLAVAAASSLVSEATGGEHGITAWISKGLQKLGVSEDVAKWVGFAVEFAVQLAGCVMTLGAGLAGWGAKGIEVAANTALKTASTVVSQVTAGLSGLNTVGTAGGSIYSAYLDKEISKSLANTKDLDAILEKLWAAMEVEKDILEAVMKKYQSLVEKAMEIIDDNNQAQSTVLTGEAFSSPSMA